MESFHQVFTPQKIEVMKVKIQEEVEAQYKSVRNLIFNAYS